MRLVVAATVIFLSMSPAITQSKDSLGNELEGLHAKWFKAFDGGDGAAMDRMEVDNLVLGMPDGTVFSKTSPRAGEQRKHEGEIQRTLSDVSVRRFEDTAVLTGVLTTTTSKEKSQELTTVVFVRSTGAWKIASAQWTPRKNSSLTSSDTVLAGTQYLVKQPVVVSGVHRSETWPMKSRKSITTTSWSMRILHKRPKL